MKPPKGPFWLWTDIGSGHCWHLCSVSSDTKEPQIKFLTDDFEDYWYDDDWNEALVEEIHPPKPLEEFAE